MTGAADRSGAAPRRPVYLLVALVTLWLAGVNAVLEGWVTVEIVRNPLSGALSAASRSGLEELFKTALVQAVGGHARLTLPLGLAELLLGGLLAVVATNALFGRRASASLALQVVGANVALLVVGYFLRAPVRESMVETIRATLRSKPDTLTAIESERLIATDWKWLFRVELLFHAAALALGAFALSRPIARKVLASDPGEDG